MGHTMTDCSPLTVEPTASSMPATPTGHSVTRQLLAYHISEHPGLWAAALSRCEAAPPQDLCWHSDALYTDGGKRDMSGAHRNAAAAAPASGAGCFNCASTANHMTLLLRLQPQPA